MPFAPNPFDALKGASKYLRKFRNATFVIKLGGEILDDPVSRKAVCEQLALLWTLAIRLVIVHGGGSKLDEVCRRLDLPIEKVAGRRVTSPEVLEAAKMVLAGSSHIDLVAELQATGMPCVGLTGVDAGLLRAHRRPPVRLRDGDGEREVDYGLVGDLDGVEPGVLEHLLAGGYVPVLAPLTGGEDGAVFNTNADTVAAQLAAALRAEKLFFVQSAPGLLADPTRQASLISYAKLSRLDELEKAGALKDGMLPKAAAIRSALLGGVNSVHLVSGKIADALLVEVFTNEGCGTMIVRRSPGDPD